MLCPVDPIDLLGLSDPIAAGRDLVTRFREVWRATQQTECELLLFQWCLMPLCIEKSLHSTVYTESRSSDF